ncbi:hypothetical protein NKH18_38430 [Streptomyces sp. M10(2022)]
MDGAGASARPSVGQVQFGADGLADGQPVAYVPPVGGPAHEAVAEARTTGPVRSGGQAVRRPAAAAISRTPVVHGWRAYTGGARSLHAVECRSSETATSITRSGPVCARESNLTNLNGRA